jgi:hypothetical protein
MGSGAEATGGSAGDGPSSFVGASFDGASLDGVCAWLTLGASSSAASVMLLRLQRLAAAHPML